MSSNTHQKQVIVILTRSPYEGSLAREAIDYCLAAAAFEQKIQILFSGDAVLQLTNNQHPETIPQKNLAKTICALPIYGVNELYVDQDSLVRYNLSKEDLCLAVTTVTNEQIVKLLANANTILNF